MGGNDLRNADAAEVAEVLQVESAWSTTSLTAFSPSSGPRPAGVPTTSAASSTHCRWPRWPIATGLTTTPSSVRCCTTSVTRGHRTHKYAADAQHFVDKWDAPAFSTSWEPEPLEFFEGVLRRVMQ